MDKLERVFWWKCPWINIIVIIVIKARCDEKFCLSQLHGDFRSNSHGVLGTFKELEDHAVYRFIKQQFLSNFKANYPFLNLIKIYWSEYNNNKMYFKHSYSQRLNKKFKISRENSIAVTPDFMIILIDSRSGSNVLRFIGYP